MVLTVLERGAKEIVWNDWKVWSYTWMFMESLKFLVMTTVLPVTNPGGWRSKEPDKSGVARVPGPQGPFSFCLKVPHSHVLSSMAGRWLEGAGLLYDCGNSAGGSREDQVTGRETKEIGDQNFINTKGLLQKQG